MNTASIETEITLWRDGQEIDCTAKFDNGGCLYSVEYDGAEVGSLSPVEWDTISKSFYSHLQSIRLARWGY